jgi:hypothetical protein
LDRIQLPSAPAISTGLHRTTRRRYGKFPFDMDQWKKIAAIAAGSFVFLLLVIVVSARLAHAPSPPAPASPWNSDAIESTLSGVRVKEIDPTHAAVMLFYDLDNRTDTDYRLANGPDVVIMSRIPSDGSLVSDQQVSLDAAAFVPARNRTRVAVEMSRPFDWPRQNDAVAESQIRQLVAAQISGVEGFVVFDRAARYEIELPTEAPQTQPASTGEVRN